MEGALVEDVGGEGTQGGVHAVLDLKADRANPQNHQTLEQRLGQTGFGCLLAHHHGTELAVVPHQNELEMLQNPMFLNIQGF